MTCTLLFHLFLFELRSAWHSPLFDSYCKTFTELPNLHQLVATLHFTAINFTTRNVSDAQLGKLNSSNYPPTLLAVSTNRLGVSLQFYFLCHARTPTGRCCRHLSSTRRTRADCVTSDSSPPLLLHCTALYCTISPSAFLHSCSDRRHSSRLAGRRQLCTVRPRCCDPLTGTAKMS